MELSPDAELWEQSYHAGGGRQLGTREPVNHWLRAATSKPKLPGISGLPVCVGGTGPEAKESLKQRDAVAGSQKPCQCTDMVKTRGHG